MLRERLVPLTSPQGHQLYADAAPLRQRHLRFPQIVAQVSPPLFAEIIWRQMARRLADKAAHHLKRRTPRLSAHQRMTPRQLLVLVLLACWLAAFFAILPFGTASLVLSESFSVVFASMSWIRVLALSAARRPARSLPEMDDSLLPSYSVLVPLFKEANVLPQLVRALSEISYPPDKLDIKIILEEKDVATRKAAYLTPLPATMEILVVPSGKPQTKPRALNYALQFSRGALLTIYDAEDIPEPMQLRRAARAFGQAAPRLACLQAELAFHNGNENWLSRQFSVEYGVQFGLILPALARHRLPLPLGGTSNHFRTDVLRQIHGWDAFNVTEDADLGLRLARAGYRSAVLRSVTLEEANVRYGNWLSQRARWLKGFLQTWLVHMRSPSILRRQVGWLGFFAVQSILFGVVLSALLHPFFLGLMAWQFINAGFTGTWFGLNNFHFGFLAANYAIMMYCGVVASRKQKLNGRIFVIATMPLYWLLTSIAGWVALWQFITQPFHWNKTKHGLSRLWPVQMKKVPLVRRQRIVG